MDTNTPSGSESPAPEQDPAASSPLEQMENTRRSYIVGVGASAGGLEALTELVSHLPVDLGVPYVVVQHLSPNYRSMLVQLLARETTMEVREVEEGLVPQPDTLYITPPNNDLVLVEDRFHLVKPGSDVVPKPSVNRFFTSLAEDRGEDVIGVILSGTGSDGASGTRAIKAGGGLVFAQDPATAKYTGMPQAAISTQCVDWVLSPKDIAREIAVTVRTQGALAPAARDAEAPATLKTLLTRVHRHTRVDFSDYKENTVWRRVLRRIAANRLNSLEAYIQFAEGHPDELNQLCREILISVTSFFRDRNAFNALRDAMAERFRIKRAGDEIRIWVPGCATGEEAYTIAILICELLGHTRHEFKIQIFATDIDTNAMAVARRGVYPASTLADLEPGLIQRYFTPSGDAYEVTKSLRELVVFARQDLAQDPPFLRLDLISCRNVLIYFQSPLQERVLGAFHYALAPGGLLFLGKSESVFQREELFDSLDREGKIFLRCATTSKAPSFILASINREPRQALRREREKTAEEQFLEAAAHAYLPPSVLVNGQLEVLHVFGDVSRFLAIPAGRPDFSLVSLIRRDLRTEVQTLIYQAQQKGSEALGRSRPLEDAPGEWVRLRVIPVSNDLLGDGAIIGFETATELSDPTTTQSVSGALDGVSARDLEDELIATREHLQTVIEELETSNEETQALNEELQASNEELQASNEELQASNEELQSTNEELTTVNEELQIKTAELADINADLENIQNSFGFHLLVFNERGRLVRLNDAAGRYFGFSHGAMGEHVHTVFAQQKLGSHAEQVEQTILDGRPREEQVSDGQRHYLMRVFPRVSAARVPRGAVVTMLDETPLIEARNALQASQEQLMAIMQHSNSIISVKDGSGRYEFINAEFERVFCRTPVDVLDKTDAQVFPESLAQSFRQKDVAVLLSGTSLESEDHYTINGEARTFLAVRFPLFSPDGVQVGICMKATDITGRKREEDRLSAIEQQWLAALAAYPGCILILDASLRLVGMHGNASGRCQGMGIACDEGASLEEVFPEEWAEAALACRSTAEGPARRSVTLPDGERWSARATALRNGSVICYLDQED